jgi:ribonuclease H-related protein
MEIKRKLETKAAEFMEHLRTAGVDVSLGTFHEYQVKLDLGKAGSASIWYSPKRDAYSLTTLECSDSRLSGQLHKLWDGLKKKSFHDDNDLSGVHMFVDGSHKNGRIGYAFVVVKEGHKIHEQKGTLRDDRHSGLLNVAGEIQAVMEGVRWAKENHIGTVTIHYDYNGLEKWAVQEWKTKTELTRTYKEFFADLTGITVQWNKVKGHSGHYYNDLADKLAGA